MYNNLIAFFTSMFLITFAEIGDKTQLLVINFSTKYKIHKVLIGIFLGSLISNSLAVFIGNIINNMPNIQMGVKFISYITFIIFGFFSITEKDDTETTKTRFFSSAIITVAFSILLGEFGDKTNLSAIALTTQFPNSYIFILLGTTFGIVFSNIFSILMGYYLNKKINKNIISIISSGLFMLFGIIGLNQTLDNYLNINVIWNMIFIMLATISCLTISIILYRKKEKNTWIVNKEPI